MWRAAGTAFVIASALNAAPTSAQIINGANVGETLTGSNIGETINGRGGDDVIFGLGGDDVLNGQAGDDVLHGGRGADAYAGGGPFDNPGIDRVAFADADAEQPVSASLASGVVANDGFGNAETMTGVEALGPGTRFADAFVGDGKNNLIFGDYGDTLEGRGLDDVFEIAGAPALVSGGAGWDQIGPFHRTTWMDANNDGLAEAVSTTQGVIVDLSQHMIVDDGWGRSGSVQAVEHIVGSAGDDTLTGNGQLNNISALGGNDVLHGREGTDKLDGGDGDDTLYGGPRIDLLIGGLGADTLYGGPDPDEFRYHLAAESSPGGHDTIMDFRLSQNDAIDLTRIDPTALAEVTIVSAGANRSMVRLDFDRDGVVDMEILVHHGPTPITPQNLWPAYP